MHKTIQFWFLQFVLLSATYATVVDFQVDENELIEIPKLLREHPFDNPDGGAWKQGWPISIEPTEFAEPEDKLNVFVVPHSHNDPGWIKTYDDYFTQQVNSILTSVLTALQEDERRSFIYAEISFFDKWWKSNPDRHDQFKQILKTGRFEFVTGGWVMNDEAASYYPAIITQLTEGHEWLRRNLNYVPQSGWSIDPFGYSPTQAYLLSLTGFEHMLIQRSGYFTSRAFFKGLDRIVETTTRTAEILHTIARITKPDQMKSIDKDVFNRIQEARRAISLFQHHDGITGTAKPHVVTDYGNRLHNARWDMKETIVQMTDVILGSSGAENLLEIDEIKKKHSDIAERKIIKIDGTGTETVVIFNPLGFERRQLVSVLVNNATIRVQDGEGAGVIVQVNPVWIDEYTVATDVFEVFFEADLPPMGFNTYFIHPHNTKIMNKRGAKTHIAEVSIKGNRKGSEKYLSKDINYTPKSESFVLSNSFITMKVDAETGLLTSYETLTTPHQEYSLKEDIVEYDPDGGAYLFLPREAAKSLTRSNSPTSIRIVKGPVLTEITTVRSIVTRTIRLYNSDNDLAAVPEVFHKVTLQNGNKEIAVRYSTDLQTDGEMYTDLNGLQYQKRKYRQDKPIQFNYYPITSSAWIQTKSKRFSVHTRQAMGAASLIDGTLELMLDRITSQDDNRGLGEPVRDNLPMEVASLLMFETSTSYLGRELSPLATRASLFLNHPLSLSYGRVESEKPWRKQYYTNYYALRNNLFPTDMHFISLRAREPMEVSEEIALQTLRLTYDEAFSNQELKPTIEPFKWFFVARLTNLVEKTLTLLHQKQEWVKGQAIPASPRDIFSFLLTFETIDPSELDHNELEEEEAAQQQEQQTPEKTVLKGADETKKDTPFMNRIVGESIESMNIAGNDPYGKPNTKQKQLIDPKLPPEVKEVMLQLQKVEAEKEELKAKLDSELYHSKSNRLVALSFVIFGLGAIIYLRKTRNIFYVFLFALLVNILVPVFLFLPESNHI